ncbi:hypothetical protein [Pseudobutyrivibrio sp. MD2005]|uniref:hypothetical protein n=1 Tax=Pseudobutyrivibrio sp. MD2005 TaxID=1410616 RepID=UPI0004891B36|nr:hypothetical protein [Pseudobutyrivibrio sp. MD2005]
MSDVYVDKKLDEQNLIEKDNNQLNNLNDSIQLNGFNQIDNIQQNQQEQVNILDNEFINQVNAHEDNMFIVRQKNRPKTKAEKAAEKKLAEARYRDAIKFDKSYTAARDDDGDTMAQIRSVMAEFFEEEDAYKEKLEQDDPAAAEAQIPVLVDRLNVLENQCNSYLRFKICFSKSAKIRTNQVKALREQVRAKRNSYNYQEEPQENFIKKGFKSIGRGIKNFFTKRIPDGFKDMGRAIKKPFTNTFSNRTAGQVAKGVLRDHIWGGIFRNAFNLVAMGAFLPFWILNGIVVGAANTIDFISGGRVLGNKKVPMMLLPTPHMPSTWTRYHNEMAAQKARYAGTKKDKSKKTKQEIKYIVSDEATSYRLNPEQSVFFKLFGWRPGLDRSGTAQIKTGHGINGRTNWEEIARRADEEMNSLINISEEDYEEDDKQEN